MSPANNLCIKMLIVPQRSDDVTENNIFFEFYPRSNAIIMSYYLLQNHIPNQNTIWCSQLELHGQMEELTVHLHFESIVVNLLT